MVATRCGEEVPAAHAMRATEPWAAVRRVVLSWAVKVLDMSVSPVRCRSFSLMRELSTTARTPACPRADTAADTADMEKGPV
ncbi:hypothetical protein Afil01_21630 [Actinorhabdospora filicis]|uniref:Uncharacterized protein n=1 Tax=Actinorhabdospora filicis TaxID=1785913 RepID=A0A9W6SKG0_9ACTN|nr:hypothetical protein Afil01_21630 [Actinorhabdospora filicis]